MNKGMDNPHVRYAINPRVQETIEFAHKMGYKRLDLLFCGGLKHEEKILSEILKEQEFELASGMCKTGRTPNDITYGDIILRSVNIYYVFFVAQADDITFSIKTHFVGNNCPNNNLIFSEMFLNIFSIQK